MNNYLSIAIWSIGIGICLCNFYIYYNKIILGGFVRRLLEKEVFSAEKALTLEQLGLSKNIFLTRALKSDSSSLYGVVAKGEQKGTYYIPDGKKEKAERMFSPKGTSLILIICLSILVLAVAYLLSLSLPWIISVTESIF